MENFIKEIESKKPRRVYYLYGPERYLINYYLQEAEDNLLDEKIEAINFDKISFQNESISSIINNANTSPFFGQEKLLIVKDTDFLSKEKQLPAKERALLEEYINNPNPSSILIFVGEDELKNAARNKLAQVFKKSAQTRLVESKILEGKALRDWLEKELIRLDLKVSRDLFENLFMIGEQGLYPLKNELDKLSLTSFTGQISLDQVEDLIIRPVEGKIFDLLDAIIEGKGQRALDLLDDYLAAREHPALLRAMLVTSFRRMIMIKDALDQGLVKPVYRKYLDTSSDFLIDKTARQVKNVSQEEILDLYEDLYEMEFQTRNSKQTEENLMKDFIIRRAFK